MAVDESMTSLKEKQVTVLGGTGFLGSAVAARAAEDGAHVTVVGRQLHAPNWMQTMKSAHYKPSNLFDEKATTEIVAGQDVVFNLVGNTSRFGQGFSPAADLDINTKVPLTVLQAVHSKAPGARVVFTSTRLVYGEMQQNPIDESHPLQPVGFYGLHKAWAEQYHRIYAARFGIESIVLRLTNVYGVPIHGVAAKGVPNLFAELAAAGKDIHLHAHGAQLRDYIYIDDAAKAICAAACIETTGCEIFNVGYGASVTMKEMAETVIRAAGRGHLMSMERPAEYAAEESGDTVIKCDKLNNASNWNPNIGIAEGIKRTVEFYRGQSDQ